MANIIADRVRETTTSTGTTTITLAGAMIGFRSFASVMTVGDTCYCCVVAVDSLGSPTGAWEIGFYTYSAANTLTRTTVLSSSNQNQPVNFIAGLKHVFLDLTAHQVNAFAQPTAPGGGGTGGTGGTGGSTDEVWPQGQNPADYFSINTDGFRDEFDGVALDTTKWHDSIWYRRGSPQSTLPKNYAVQNGSLYVWPQLWGGSGAAPGYPNYNGFYERDFATDGKFAMQYGFFEMECKLPRGRGLFPAFWLFNHAASENVIHTEIDVMEAYPGGYDGNVNAFLYADVNLRPTDYVFTVWNNQVTNDRAGHQRMAGGSNSYFPTKDLSATYNVYGCRWDSSGITPYFNGQPLYVKADIDNSVAIKLPSTKYTQANFASRPMYLLIDLWMGRAVGNESPNPNVSETPQGQTNSFEIRYVRAWKLRNP